jgi:hypothetical protein
MKLFRTVEGWPLLAESLDLPARPTWEPYDRRCTGVWVRFFNKKVIERVLIGSALFHGSLPNLVHRAWHRTGYATIAACLSEFLRRDLSCAPGERWLVVAIATGRQEGP